MKATPYGYYGLSITPENDAERVWLAQFLGGFTKKFVEDLGTNITVNLEGMCVMEDGTPAEELTVKEALNKDGDAAWGLVDELRINAGGL